MALRAFLRLVRVKGQKITRIYSQIYSQNALLYAQKGDFLLAKGPNKGKTVAYLTTGHGKTTKKHRKYVRPYLDRVGRSPVRIYFTAFSALEAALTINLLSPFNFFAHPSM